MCPKGTKTTTFVQDLVDGKTDFNHINAYIDTWHTDPAGKGPLREFLGFSEEEYKEFLKTAITDDFKEKILWNHQYEGYSGHSESSEMLEYLDDMAEGACEGGR